MLKVGAAHAATQETYSLMRKVTSTGRRDIEKIVVKAGKEGLQWGKAETLFYVLEQATDVDHLLTDSKSTF